MSRNVKYSDGTLVGGEGTGTILDGTPGVDAYYTGYHWTKACCETCGTMNTNDGGYDTGKNVYVLYDCATEFMEKLDETVTYEYTDSTYHTKTVKGGTYCVFCYGTNHTTSTTLERHDLETSVLPQPANGRFAIVESCKLCDYSSYEYVAAKSVVANYYGVVDGKAHTLTVTDLSESGVTTQIRYGDSADNCTLTSAPNYTEAGQYTVYYAITYTYKNTTMTENGVAYVWLRDDSTTSTDSNGNSTCVCGCKNPDCGCQDKNCGGDCCTDKGCGDNHNYTLLDSVSASCLTLGYDRYLCVDCGKIEKRDYTAALGHSWDDGTLVTNATCTGEGVMEYRCERCGYHRLEAVSATGHTPGEEATCTQPQLCAKCGAVIVSALGHSYKSEVTAPTCTEMGYTTYTCDRCGDSYKGDYTDATGHKLTDWITDQEPTTDSEGSKHKECENCGETMETAPIEKLYMSATTDSKGEAVVGGYLVIVTDTDTKNPVSNATVNLSKDDTLSIRLPDGRLIDYADQTTVTVLLTKDKSPVEGMFIAVTDKNSNYAADKTDAAGQITIPGTSGQTGSDGNATVGWQDADGNRWTLTVKVEDYETGRPIQDAGVSIGSTGNITVKLPDGTDMDENNRITVTVTDNQKNPQGGLTVIVNGDLNNSATGTTDENGKLTVPAVTQQEKHGVYIVGYTDGTFGAECNMTRAEAAAIFARLLAEKKSDTITTVSATKYSDIPANAWYSGYVKYLTGYGVVTGYSDDTFAPDDSITRAQFTAMAVRFFDAYGDGAADIMEKYQDFSDVSSGYWAAEYIKDAAIHGWIFGYTDGTFRAEQEITRAEAVAIVNRLLGRTADQQYVAENLNKLNTFSDMTSDHWAYYAVMEAANGHIAILGDTESWSK